MVYNIPKNASELPDNLSVAKILFEDEKSDSIGFCLRCGIKTNLFVSNIRRGRCSYCNSLSVFSTSLILSEMCS